MKNRIFINYKGVI